MSPSLLRQLWLLVESTQSAVLLRLDDASLVQWLNKQIKATIPLNSDEANLLDAYIQSRISLIRDLAQERQTAWQHMP
jgi:hypothetical protein